MSLFTRYDQTYLIFVHLNLMHINISQNNFSLNQRLRVRDMFLLNMSMKGKRLGFGI